jgi:FkbM family methyltransferase
MPQGNISEYELYGLPGGSRVGSAQESRVLPWVAANGDSTRRLDYKLTKDSIVYDIGGYVGEWAEAIDKRFGCHIEIFEPIKKYADLLATKFANNKNIVIHNFGLGGKTERLRISLEDEASSVFKKSVDSELVQIKKVSGQLYHDHIDLMKMNIEGGEFGLLNDLIKSGKITSIDNLQIQFHDFAPNAKSERQKLHRKLSLTHSLTYNYPFVWENWRLRND